MIPVPSGVRVWLAVGHTDMRRGMNGLALQVQEALGRDPHAGDLYVFRGKRGDLLGIRRLTEVLDYPRLESLALKYFQRLPGLGAARVVKNGQIHGFAASS